MACNIQQIKIDGINKVKKIFKGGAASISFDDKMSTKLNITFGSEYKVKTKAQAYNMVQSKITKIDKWSKDTFKTDAFKGQWTTMYQNNDNISVEFSFPKSLLKAYETKLNKDNLSKVDFNDLKNDYKPSIFEIEESKKIIDEDFKKGEDTFEIKNIDLSTLENRLKNLQDKVNVVVDHQIKSLDKSRKKSKTKVFKKHLRSVKKAMKKHESVDQYKGIVEYLKNAQYAIERIRGIITDENFDADKMRISLEYTKRYFSLYGIINDIQEMRDDLIDYSEISDEEIKIIDTLIDDVKINYDKVKNKFTKISMYFYSKMHNTIKAHPEIESEWENKFKSQYRVLFKGNKDKLKDTAGKTEWVRSKMIDHSEEIQSDIDKAVQSELYNDQNDIGYTAYLMTSSLEIDSKPVQLAQFIFTEIRDAIYNEIEPIDVKLDELHKRFTKGKTNNVAKLYKNMYEQNSNGDWYLKGLFKSEFLVGYGKWQELVENTTEMRAIYDETENQNDLENYQKAKELSDKQYDLLYTRDEHGNIEIKNEWRNDLKGLSKLELEVLFEFRTTIDESHKATHGWNSLKKSTFGDGEFYKLPTHTKTNKERLLDGTRLRGLKEDVEGLYEIRPDDIGYAKTKATINGEIIMDNPIHFRGSLKNPKDQSLDLFGLMRKETMNYIAFKHKTKRQLELDIIMDVAKNVKYKKTMGMGTKMINQVTGRQLASSHFEENANVIKKLQGMYETQMYDITKQYAGELNGRDINKLIGAINGYTGFLGMTLNYHSAIANAVSGNAQTLIHGIAKDVINLKDIKKATKIYYAHNRSNLNDLSNVRKKSLPNQILKMFDIFGGYNIGINSFLDDKKWKHLIDKDTFTFMHSMGEHQIQSIVTMAVLNSVLPIDKHGLVIKDKTLLDMLSVNSKTGIVEMDKSVVYTSHSKLTKWNEGGKIETQHLIKHKINVTQGVYDKNIATEAEKNAFGSLLMMYRKFFPPLARDRFRGFTTAAKKKEDITREEKYFSYANKEFREGFYTTSVRFVTHIILPSLKQLKLDIMTSNWNELTDHERSNIIKFITEIAGGTIMVILARMIAGIAADGDDEKLYFLAYMFRRTASELRQFSNPNEMIRMTSSPFASLRTIENLFSLGSNIGGTVFLDPKAPKRAGKNMLKLLPVIGKTQRTNKQMYNYLEVMLK